MVNIYKYIQNDEILKNSATMLLQVHDELIFEVEESIVKNFAKVITPLMTDQNLLSGVPLSVNTGTAKNWAEAH
jgi:DNA polymerase I - 3''-5'' exonuclease and polymerase domains